VYQSFVSEHKGVHVGGMTYTTALPGFRFDRFERRLLDVACPLGRAMLADDNGADALEVIVPLARKEKV
jgi:hypothetical protein